LNCDGRRLPRAGGQRDRHHDARAAL